MTLEEIQAKAHAVVAARCAADVLTQEYNLLLAQECARRGCPPGISIDVFGDGKSKPVAQCKILPPPRE